MRGAGLGLHERDELVHAVAQEVGGPVRAGPPAPRASVRLHAGKASAAAAAAASTWATDASGAWPTTASVAGLTMS